MSETNESSCATPGHFSWNELITTDPIASATFYGSLFGWQTTPFTPKGAPEGGPSYTLFKTDVNDRAAGGMMQSPEPGIPPPLAALCRRGERGRLAHQGRRVGRENTAAGDGHRRGGTHCRHSRSAGCGERPARAAEMTAHDFIRARWVEHRILGLRRSQFRGQVTRAAARALATSTFWGKHRLTSVWECGKTLACMRLVRDLAFHSERSVTSVLRFLMEERYEQSNLDPSLPGVRCGHP